MDALCVCVYLRVQIELLSECLSVIEPPLTNERGQPLLRQCLHQLPHDHTSTLQLSVVHTVLEGVILTTRTSTIVAQGVIQDFEVEGGNTCIRYDFK